MKESSKKRQLILAAFFGALALTTLTPISGAYAQKAPTASLSESAVMALQEALNKQVIAVKSGETGELK